MKMTFLLHNLSVSNQDMLLFALLLFSFEPRLLNERIHVLTTAHYALMTCWRNMWDTEDISEKCFGR